MAKAVILFALLLYGYAGATQDKIKMRLVATNNEGIESVSNFVTATRPLNIYIPNAFTPNGDGLNDQFIVKGEGIDFFQMSVFDRWGKLLFQSSHPELGWDGKINGEAAPGGVYTFEVVAEGYEIGTFQKAGTVILAHHD